MTVSRLRSFLLSVPWSIWVVFSVRILFLVTYSPNIGGDAINYLRMMIRWHSNLMHAPGYPFLFGLVFHHHPFGPYALRSYPQPALYSIVAVQHMVDMLVLLMSFKIVSRIFNRASAHVSALIYGLSWGVIGTTSWFQPEWLQADLLVVCFCIAYYGLSTADPVKKRRFYALAGSTFAFCYLTKYNAAFVAPFLVLIIMLDRVAWRARIFHVLVAGGAAAVCLVPFIFLYHLPCTGTTTLTMDKAWVLESRLDFMGLARPEPQCGPNTKRLLILSYLLPKRGSKVPGIGPVENVNHASSPEFKKPYREKYGYILKASDRELDKLLKTIGDRLYDKFEIQTSWNAIAYYIGLPEANKNGVGVFIECVRFHPGQYIRSVLGRAWREGIVEPRTWPIFPINVMYMRHMAEGYGFVEEGHTSEGAGLAIVEGANRWGFLHLKQKETSFWTERFPNPYGYHVWLPGAWFFRVLVVLEQAIPGFVVSLVILLGTMAYVVRFFRTGRLGEDGTVYLILAVLSLFFLVVSNAVFVFRWDKELRFIMPVVALLSGVGLVGMARLIGQSLHALRPASFQGKKVPS